MGQETNTHDDDGKSDRKGTTGGMREGVTAIFPCGRGRIEKGMRINIVRPTEAVSRQCERLGIMRLDSHFTNPYVVANSDSET